MTTVSITPEVKRAVLYALRVRAAEIAERLEYDRRLLDRPGIEYWSQRQDESDKAIALFHFVEG